MRVGEYELRLLGPSGEPFPEVQHTNGQTYAVASPGTSFTISFSLLPHAVPLLGIFRAVSYGDFWPFNVLPGMGLRPVLLLGCPPVHHDN